MGKCQELFRNLFQPRKEDRNPSESIKPNFQEADLDLLGTIFGTEEARSHLLGVNAPKNVSPEQVLRDAQALELMMRTFPWRIYNEALWRKLITALRNSLTESYTDANKQTVMITPAQREGFRYEVLAFLSILHLPYELKADKDRVQKMKELEREALSR